MPSTTTATTRPAWNASTKPRRPSTTKTTAKRVGGGYVPSVPTPAPQQTAPTGTVAARTPSRPRQAAGDRAGSSQAKRTRIPASRSLLKELEDLKNKNAELVQALNEKTLQLDSALEEVSLLKLANQDVNKQLDAYRKEEEECIKELDKAIEVIQGAQKLMDVDESELEDSALSYEQLSESPAMTISTEATEQDSSEDQDDDEVSQDSKKENNISKWIAFEEFEDLSKLSKQEQNQPYWDLFQEFYKEEEIIYRNQIEELKKNNQHAEARRWALEWSLFEDVINHQKRRDGCK